MNEATTTIAEDRIEKQIELKAPRARVWRALTDHREFSEWFGVNLTEPFAVGKKSQGQMSTKEYGEVTLALEVKKMEPEKYFSYTWHPFSLEKGVDYSKETPTLVEFRLEEIPSGTRLTVVESGFSKIPEARRALAFRKHGEGWVMQLESIAEHVAQNA
ncbi:MAG: SRPBCC family protein [Verrucomicrobiota bacterium]|nr:SRPBCC family protein [Verrucomicrobiota bacterium]